MRFNISGRRLRALIRKETYQMLRDPSTLMIAFFLPIVLLLLFGYGVNLDASRVRLGIVNEDHGVESSNFLKAVDGTNFIKPTIASSFEPLSVQLQKGGLDGIIIIPADFSKKIVRNESTDIKLITDGAQPNAALFTMGYVQSLGQVYAQNRALQLSLMPEEASVTITPRYWFNPSTISRNALLPGSIAITMTIIGALLTSLIVAREWERGTMEGLLSTPITRTEFLLSKIIPYFFLSLIAMAISVLLTIFVMRVPFNGSYLILLVMTSLFSLSALGLGLLISTITKNQFNAAQMALFAAFLPAVMLSGFIYEVSSMPQFLRALTSVIPARYFVTTLQTLFQANNVPSLLLKNMVALLILAVFWLGLTALKTKNRLD